VTASSLNVAFAVALGLLAVGLYGVLISRHLIKILIALQILTKAAALLLVVAGRASGQPGLGQSVGITVIVADTIIVVLGLALAVQVQRRFGTLDVSALSTLKR
jgi:NADH:ubiquinone oxidoreductase subunit K